MSRWSRVLAALAPACRRAPTLESVAPLEDVETSGCERVDDGPVCVVGRDGARRVFVPGAEAVTTRAEDGSALVSEERPVGGGAQLRIVVPALRRHPSLGHEA